MHPSFVRSHGYQGTEGDVKIHEVFLWDQQQEAKMEKSRAIVCDISPVEGASATLSSRSKKGKSSSKINKESNLAAPRVLPAVGAYAVQCVKCFKWRFIPSKEQYEAIRHWASADPWVCNRASAWRPNASCNDPAELSQDITRLWIIDKPNIPRPPTGWERLLSLRGDSTCRFADVYYISPSGKKLRSKVEIEKFLEENPQYAKGVDISQFNYQIPRPLHEEYLRKRNASAAPTRGRPGRNAKTKKISHEKK